MTMKKEFGKCTQHIVRAVRARENGRCDFRVYGKEIRYRRKLRQDAREMFGFQSKYIESIISYLIFTLKST